MKYRGHSILESFGVPLGLFHGLGDVQSLHPFALYVDSREAEQVRFLPITLRAAQLYMVAVGLEGVGQLDLTGTALSL